MPYPLVTPGGSPDIYPANTSLPNPAYSGTFIPEIWSGKLIEKFYASTVLAAIANTDWAGEIKSKGDTVNIRTKPTISIKEYEANQDLEVERPSSNIVTLVIDKGFYFNTMLDDVMETQADMNLLSMWADDASEQMKIKIDTECLTYLTTAITDTAQQGDAAGAISGSLNLGTDAAPLAIVPREATTGQVEPVDVIVAAGQALDEQNIPEAGRWIVIPAWMASAIKRSELRDASLTGDGMTMLRNGRLGMIDRFTVYASNLLPISNAGQANEYTNIVAGHSHGFTFASQLTEMETLRSERTFSNVMRGLQVYGRKVVDQTSLVLIRAAAA